MAVDLELAPKTKRPAGEPCCEPVVYPGIEREGAQAERTAIAAKALGDPVRLQLVDVLRKHAGKVCVCELVPLFDLSQPTVSHHLKVLREAGIVGSERQGLVGLLLRRARGVEGVVRMAELEACCSPVARVPARLGAGGSTARLPAALASCAVGAAGPASLLRPSEAAGGVAAGAAPTSLTLAAATSRAGLYRDADRERAPRRGGARLARLRQPNRCRRAAEGETVLDLGSGGGIDVLLSARRVGPTGQGLRRRHDGRDARLARAQHARGRGDERRVPQGRSRTVPLPDDVVDVVISNCVINLSPDKPRFSERRLGCCARVVASR